MDSRWMSWRSLLVLELFQEVVEPGKALLPEGAVAPGPVGNVLDGFGGEAARAPLRLAAAGDEAGAFEDLEVTGNRRQADVERLRQGIDGRGAEAEAFEDGAPRGVGKGGEDGTEAVSLQSVISK